jgi:alpha-amylase
MRFFNLKLLALLLTGTLTFGLAACGGDDADEPTPTPTPAPTPDPEPTPEPPTTVCEGWPAQYGGVMLQAFYWDSFDDSQWTELQAQADQFAGTFDLVWLPQSGNCGGTSMGYDDLYWFNNYNSSFGNEQQLRQLISTFKSKGIKTIADVVINHRRNLSNWVDFPKETYRGVTYEMKSTDICANDDNGATKTWATQNGYTLSTNNDTGEGWDGMRDLDHKSENVQTIVKAYLDFLKNDLGYAGFRYDMVKGYSASFTGIYNAAAMPEFSVGECWDGTAKIKSWIEGTKKDGQIQSAAFDFQFRYTVRNAMNNGNYARLAQQNDGSWPLVSSNLDGGKYRRYAVTFVENHDTERRSNAAQDPLVKDTLAANAYMMAMPGTPCVFLKHWLAYKQEIANMVAVRKAVGVNSESVPTQVATNMNYYAVQVAGTGGRQLLCVVGSKAADYTPEGAWKKVISGYHYIYYVQGIEPSAITLPVLPQEEQQTVEVPSFCTVTAGETCAFFEAPTTWTADIMCWAWIDNGDNFTGGTWPGAPCTLLGTANSGKKVYKWTYNGSLTTKPGKIIFSNNGTPQTENLPFQNGGYYTKDGLKAVVTP